MVVLSTTGQPVTANLTHTVTFIGGSDLAPIHYKYQRPLEKILEVISCANLVHWCNAANIALSKDVKTQPTRESKIIFRDLTEVFDSSGERLAVRDLPTTGGLFLRCPECGSRYNSTTAILRPKKSYPYHSVACSYCPCLVVLGPQTNL